MRGAPRRLVVVGDAAAREQAVVLAHRPHEAVGGELCDAVGRARAHRRGLVLRGALGRPVHLARRRDPDPRARLQRQRRGEQRRGPARDRRDGRGRVAPAVRHERRRGEVVERLRPDALDDRVQRSGVEQVGVVDDDALADRVEVRRGDRARPVQSLDVPADPPRAAPRPGTSRPDPRYR